MIVDFDFDSAQNWNEFHQEMKLCLVCTESVTLARWRRKVERAVCCVESTEIENRTKSGLRMEWIWHNA